MTHNVFSGTLNLALSIYLSIYLSIAQLRRLSNHFMQSESQDAETAENLYASNKGMTLTDIDINARDVTHGCLATCVTTASADVVYATPTVTSQMTSRDDVTDDVTR